MEILADGEELTVNYTYDEAGRLVKVWDSEDGETLYSYDKAGNLIKEEGKEERHYLYDASGRLTAIMDQDNLLLAALYDGNDNRVFTMEYAPELSADRLLTPKPDEDTEDKGKEDETGNRTGEGEDEDPGDPSHGGHDRGTGNAAGNPSGTGPEKNSTGNTRRTDAGSPGLLSGQGQALQTEKKVTVFPEIRKGVLPETERRETLQTGRWKAAAMQDFQMRKLQRKVIRKAQKHSGTECSARRRIFSCPHPHPSRHGSMSGWALGMM